MPVTKATKIAIRDEFEAIGRRALAQFNTDHFAMKTGRVNWTVDTPMGLLSCQLFDGLGLNRLARTDPYAAPWVSGRFHDIEKVRPSADLFGRSLSFLTGNTEMKLSGEAKSQCCQCGKYFTSTRAFDRHQIDQFENARRPVRCMSVVEMETKGFSKTPKGFWAEPNRPRKTDRQVPTKDDAPALFAAAA